jgi:branched-chain amino acid transport system permease protein
VGYCGQISLGTGGFMAVGAYAAYNLLVRIDGMPLVLAILLGGVFSMGIGVLFGIPSLRIKGFYLAVATLAAQFFLEWCFVRIPWLFNYNISGAIEVPNRSLFGVPIVGPNATPLTRYYAILAIVVALTWIASNIVRGRIGRMWMAVRDMDIAAELMGIRLLRAKLLAFAVSSYFCGVAGAVMMFLWYGGGEAKDAFSINLSFTILFMVIIGGLGSLTGAFFGAALLHLVPIFLKFGLPALGFPIGGATAEHLTHIIIGALIVFFLIVEPHGLARLWATAKQKLRLWPFPY